MKYSINNPKKFKLVTLDKTQVVATPKQIGFIASLTKSNGVKFNREKDGIRLTKFQASKVIDSCLKKIPIKFVDTDLHQVLKNPQRKRIIDIPIDLEKAKQPIKVKPKRIEYTQVISYEEQQAKLRRLES